MSASVAPLQRARRDFQRARRAFAAAVFAEDVARVVAAAWGVLHAFDRLDVTALHPSPRDRCTWCRWRRFALAALRCDPPPAGLLDRIRQLTNESDRDAGAAGDNRETP